MQVDIGLLAGGDGPLHIPLVAQGGKIDIGSGSTGGPQQALAVVMTDEATPKVESLALVVDGNADAPSASASALARCFA